jgi:ubiquinone/menaquinone biosynthesis C-methylase UbiE/uncharacterized protein YbaR (Trm112 family)
MEANVSLEAVLGPHAERLRCPACAAHLRLASVTAAAPRAGGEIICEGCSRRFPLIAGTPRLLPDSLRRDGDGAPEADVKRRTADSFAYEWQRFGVMAPEWERNFAEYLQPHDPSWLRGKEILDVGAGSGRHSLQAARHGARVVAVDLGESIDVARENLPDEVLTVQADAESLPFEHRSFDFVMSIGVLHHLPDPERALHEITRFARPGGRVHIYLYWQPERWSHRVVLSAVTAIRRITTRLPHSILHAMCYPLSAALLVTVVSPYRLLRKHAATRRLANFLPLKTYADYPFRVLVNDQFDRFSAPLERRYTRKEVADMMRRAGLSEVTVVPNAGWVADGVAPGHTV